MSHKVVAHQDNLMKNYSSCSTPIEVNPTSTELAINLSSRSHLPTKIGTFPNIKQLSASMAVAKIARPATVQIYTSSDVSGAGVIIKRQDNIYTVLTANHIVKQTDAKYMIQTHTGKNYPAILVRQLDSNVNTYNLSIIQFSTSDVYPVATLSHTDETLINTDVFFFGYSQALDYQKQEFEFFNGTIVDFCQNNSWHYNTLTNSGISGSLLFNAQGHVIGIYITREVVQLSQTGIKTVRDINTFIPLPSLKNILCSELKLKFSPTTKFQELVSH